MTVIYIKIMAEKDLNEIAPWGKEWGRTSKREYKNTVLNLLYQAEQLKAIIYMRDMLYNGCHESQQITDSWKPLNKPKQ